jgi:two-component system, NarL family, sensor kinase
MDQLSKEITIVIIATIFLAFIAVGVVILVLVYQKRQLQYKKDKEKQILESRIEAQEQTLKKVSQEIHDNIGQALTLVKMNINAVDTTKPGMLPDSVKEILESSKDLLTKVIQDLRDLARLLSTDYIQHVGLLSAIQQQLHILQNTKSYETQFTITGNPYELPAQHELEIFRIVQELLNNIVKHAEATSIVITMDYQKDMLLILVNDNGKGFKELSLQMPNNKGVGLYNIRNRVKLLNGTINFDCTGAVGTSVMLKLPIN